MSDKKLLSIAEIARELEVPESTLHYWKNRFSQYLPSMGKKRQKRFKPEAIEIFKIISKRLKQGHTAEDVMSELSRMFPVNVSIMESESSSDSAVQHYNDNSSDKSLQIASTIGAEIARSITEGLKHIIPQTSAAPSLPGTLHEDVEQAVCLLTEQGEEVEQLKDENKVLKEKLCIMEAEMIRLRKDRRELEKYLLDKLKAVTK
ncbi:MerR family transcriptional regulator [Maridesulfovibrio bastinii]|uniref:MerR family transcriptional regulator n=1 Tax=Maridesulfovibrio bastinii TaxID=47157 RepID=UPI00040ACA34|nr:MerR family transcriptional regulator [Maridesulfovibrio bastinii]